MPKGGRIERKRKDGGVSKVKKTGAKTEKAPPKLQRFQGTLKEGQTLKNIDGVTYVFSNGGEVDKDLLREGFSVAAKKFIEEKEEKRKSDKERRKKLALQQTEEAAGKKKKTTSEFRNGGVVDLGDFKGSF